MHPNRQFLNPFVVFMPSNSHVLLCVKHPLCSPGGGEGTVTLGGFPWGCEDTVVHRWLLFRRGGGGVIVAQVHPGVFVSVHLLLLEE